MQGILHGVKVLGIEQQVAAPVCTMMLADQGAEIIKVERPKGGDTAKRAFAAMMEMKKIDVAKIEAAISAKAA